MGITAIFGGTFNPFHNGHYQIISALEKDAKIEKILIMPDKIPPHKECDFLASDADRLQMCKIAAADFSKAEVCDIELLRDGKSYTYDTVLNLKSLYPNANFAFVCGADMLVFFEKWYNYRELMELLPFIVFDRTDTDSNELDCYIKKFRSMGMQITVMNDVIADVSSSEFRNSPIKDLLPEKIYDYIVMRGIYNV